jgi:hypothetical protein
MTIYIECKSCSDLGRVIVLKDPSIRPTDEVLLVYAVDLPEDCFRAMYTPPARGLLRTSTRTTLNLLLFLRVFV